MSDSIRQPPRAICASATTRAPRAAIASAEAGGDQGVVVGVDAQDDVAGAQQERVERLLGDAGDATRGRVAELAAQHLARERGRRRRERARHVLLQRVELARRSSGAGRRPAPSSAPRSSA